MFPNARLLMHGLLWLSYLGEGTASMTPGVAQPGTLSPRSRASWKTAGRSGVIEPANGLHHCKRLLDTISMGIIIKDAQTSKSLLANRHEVEIAEPNFQALFTVSVNWANSYDIIPISFHKETAIANREGSRVWSHYHSKRRMINETINISCHSDQRGHPEVVHLRILSSWEGRGLSRSLAVLRMSSSVLPRRYHRSSGFCSSSQCQVNSAEAAEEHSRVHLCRGLALRMTSSQPTRLSALVRTVEDGMPQSTP
ncbi:unnamed protein product [Nezara viridula]|uniref:Neuropeptide n=1 Tax=Nezara viridula TaxID=85310 RepID=A0A9P0EHP0_NEZVI|nr:unnamed protein product [Nezara viridula]